MFKKRAQKGQSRRKRAEPDHEPAAADADDAAAAGAAGAPAAAKPKKKKRKKEKAKLSSMLSFGDEEEEAGDALPVLKKVANPSLSFRRGAERAEKKPAAVPTASMYSAESLNALKESSFSYGGGHVPVYKPTEEEAAVMAAGDGMDEASETGGDGDGGVGGSIPDASSIQRARERRERLRKQGEYIPLEGGGGDSDGGDDDKDDDDDGADLLADPADAPTDERVVMKAGATPRSARKRAEVEAALADGADFYRGDDELQRLEAQHVRSAMTGAVPTGRDTLNLRDTTAMGGGGLRGQSQRHSSLKEIRIDDVCRTLRSSLRQQEEQLGKHQRELVSNAEAAKLTAVDLSTLDSKLKALEPKYQYLQELWIYVDSMTACMDSKVDLIEECEVQLLELEKSQAEGAEQRRWLLLDDLADSITEPHTGEKSKSENQRSNSSSGKTIDLDEFGRDRNHTIVSALTAGADKRAEARQGMVGRMQATDSVCDSDEEELYEKAVEDREGVRTEKSEILQAAAVIFADASDDFSTVTAVASRMEEWKQKQPRSYHDTYVSINLIKIFSPFVRLDMLAWHPTDRCIEALAQQGWFIALENYGMASSGNGNGIAADDLDLELIPSLVEKVVLPRLIAWLRNGWDPMSRRSTDAALQCVNELTEVYVTVEKPGVTALLATVLNRLQSTADRIRVPAGTGTAPSSASTAAADRGAIANYLFNRAAGFVRNAAMWSQLLAAGPLEALVATVVGNQMCPLLACMHTITTERSGQEWLPKLQRLVDALKTKPGATSAGGGSASSWLESTIMLKHIVRAAVTASPRAKTLGAEESADYAQLAAALP